MAFLPYLAFAGSCREAFSRYQEVFGGELVLLTMSDAPPDAGLQASDKADLITHADLIMHAALRLGDQLLLGADDPSGGFDGNVHGMCVNWSTPEPAEAHRVFEALADGGEVQMPVSETFFSPAFGMCRDRFGTPWMIMADQPGEAAS